MPQGSSPPVEESPMPDLSKRPSYLEVGVLTGLPPSNFDEAVIKSLEPQFNAVAAEDGQVEQIRTFLRVRPYVKRIDDELEVIEIKDDKTVVANLFCPGQGLLGGRAKRKMEFKFTKVLDGACNQESVFEEIMEPLLDFFDAGDNCLIFSYGATNSGKTYTMRGSASKYGIIPRTLYRIFNRYQDRIYKGGDVQPFRHESTRMVPPDQQQTIFERKKGLIASVNDTIDMKQRVKNLVAPEKEFHDISIASSHCVSMQCVEGAVPNDVTTTSMDGNSTLFGMWVSFVELYNEKCYDLLSPGKRTEVKIISEKGGSSYFKDVTELPVFNEEEAFALYVAGYRKLEMSATQINLTSSRSHSFFSIRAVELGKASTQSVYPIRVYRMTFCDLAGCERVSQTENSGCQLRESANINNSLLSLLKIIRMIRNRQNQGQVFLEKIPFRESKLTRIFQGYFTTSTHIGMIVNVNPSPKMAESSLQTLINSAIASNVVTFRPQTTTHIALEPETRRAFLHSSLDLEDVPEETEEDEAEEENIPPPILKPMIKADVENKRQGRNNRGNGGHGNGHTPRVNGNGIRAVLKEQNNIQQQPQKAPGTPRGTGTNGKKESQIVQLQKQLLAMKLQLDHQQDIIATLNTDVKMRDRLIYRLQSDIKTKEFEVREQMMKRMDQLLQNAKEIEQRKMNLALSELREKLLSSHFSRTQATQTENPYFSQTQKDSSDPEAEEI